MAVPNVQCDGPDLWIMWNVTKAKFMHICDMMHCYPEESANGGIRYLLGEKHITGYKCIHFAKIKPISTKIKSPQEGSLSWPKIQEKTDIEWRKSDDILIYENTKICTTLLITEGASPFSGEEIKEWRRQLERYCIYMCIPEAINISHLYFKPEDFNSYTYLIHTKGTNTYKIGKAKSPVTRLGTLQTGNSQILTLTATCIGGFTLETYLHRLFQDKKRMGEWYDLSTSDIKEILDIFRTISSLPIVQLLTNAEHEYMPLEPALCDFLGPSMSKNTTTEPALCDFLGPSMSKNTTTEPALCDFLGPSMSKNTTMQPQNYPECPGPRCWCYYCAMDTMRSLYYTDSKYDVTRHEAEARQWAENCRSLWCWQLIPELHPTKPIFNVQKSSCEGKHNILVVAMTISSTMISFECPFCWSRFSVNGNPYPGAKRVIHEYNHNNKINFMTNTIFYMPSPCNNLALNSYYISKGNFSPFPTLEYGFFAIIIDDTTQRISKKHAK